MASHCTDCGKYLGSRPLMALVYCDKCGPPYKYKCTPVSGAFAPLYARTITEVCLILRDMYPDERFRVHDIDAGEDMRECTECH
ncbi:hypothetical protein LCGC14_2595260, partial [marine sediment metagenome]